MAKKTALITGCSAGGISHALAALLGGKGYHVLATVRNPAKAEALIETGDKLRYPVGQDANLIVAARKAMTDEQFESTPAARPDLVGQ